MTKRNIHFVGSIGLEDADTVFRTLADLVGDKASRYPDGETGVRHYWIVWQRAIVADHPDFEFGMETPPLTPGANPGVRYRLRDGVDPAAVEFPPLGYAKAALESYVLFAQLRNNGEIPAGTRFQVSIPTPAAVINSWLMPEEAAAIAPAYERAIVNEVQRIIDGIPAEDLAIQWDVCIEIVAHDGGMPIYLDDPRAYVMNNVMRLAGQTPPDADVGIHLCYGDPGHKHIIEPADLGTCVDWANGMCAHSPRPINFMHMPVPRDRSDDAYFAPLANLDIGDAELSLGLVHITDGLEGTQGRIAAAEKFVSDFGISTECGFGRRPAETIPELLRIHAEAAS